MCIHTHIIYKCESMWVLSRFHSWRCYCDMMHIFENFLASGRFWIQFGLGKRRARRCSEHKDFRCKITLASGLRWQSAHYYVKGTRIDTLFVDISLSPPPPIFLTTPQPHTSRWLKFLLALFSCKDYLSLCMFQTSEAHKGNTCVLYVTVFLFQTIMSPRRQSLEQLLGY